MCIFSGPNSYLQLIFGESLFKPRVTSKQKFELHLNQDQMRFELCVIIHSPNKLIYGIPILARPRLDVFAFTADSSDRCRKLFLLDPCRTVLKKNGNECSQRPKTH